jgi:hypothetical protein
VVSGRPPHRFREPGLVRPRLHEKQGSGQKERTDAKTSAQIWDGGPIYFWDTWLDDRQLHVFSVGVEGGEPVNLTAGTGLELPRPAVQLNSALYDISPDGKELAFVADSDPAVNNTNLDVYTLAIGGKDAMNRSASNLPTTASRCYSPDGRWLALVGLRQTFIEPPTLVSIDTRRGSTTKLSTINDALLAATDFGTYESSPTPAPTVPRSRCG